MKRFANISIAVVALIALIAVGVSYYKYLVVRDYPIETEIDCDPTLEECFISECEDNCESQDVSYYKKIIKNAAGVLDCNPFFGTCPEEQCTPGQSGCEVTTCDDSSSSNQSCSDPEMYNVEHPQEVEDTPLAPKEGDVLPEKETNTTN